MYYQTRKNLTETDFEFIAQTLGETPEEKSALLGLMDDPFSITHLLHQKKLFERTLTSPPLLLTLSPHLFFYLFIYQALDHKRIADDDVVDYISGVCVEFRSCDSLWRLGTTQGGKTVYVVDLLGLLENLDRAQQYFLRRYIGNVTLFLTGFFPDFVFGRSKQLGAPPIEYYEEIGRSQYESAASESFTYDESAASVLTTLAERFVEIRSAMNIYCDAYLNLTARKHSLETLERQLATLDDQSLRETLDLQ